MFETAFTPEGDATGTTLFLHYTSLCNKAVKAHAAAKVTGFLCSEHGVDSGVLIGANRNFRILLGRLRDRRVYGKFKLNIFLVLEQRVESVRLFFRLIELEFNRGNIVTLMV